MKMMTKKVLAANIVIAILVIILIPVTIYAAYQASQVLYNKVKNAGYSQEEMMQLDSDLKKYGFGDKDISILNELHANESGLTYGPDILGADLIEVVSQEGNMGYIYRKDLEEIEANSIDEAIQEKGDIKITVYDKEGEKNIGTFRLTQ